METSIIPSAGVTNLNYSIVTTPVTGSKETTYRPITPYVTYMMAEDDIYAVGNRRKKIGSKNDWTLKATISTTNDAVSPIISEESLFLNVWENFLDNGEITSDDFTIIAPGSKYSNANLISVTSSTGSGANANVTVDANGNVVGIYVTSSGSGYLDDFTISYYTHPTTPATIVLNSEFDSSGGPCLARYIMLEIYVCSCLQTNLVFLRCQSTIKFFQIRMEQNSQIDLMKRWFVSIQQQLLRQI
jgi:hypothetical protein